MPPKVCCARALGANVRVTQRQVARMKIESRTLCNIRSSVRCEQTSEREFGPKARTVIFCVLLNSLSRRLTAPQRWRQGTLFSGRCEVFFYLWQISIISMPDFHREHRYAGHVACSRLANCEIAARQRLLMRYHPCSRELR